MPEARLFPCRGANGSGPSGKAPRWRRIWEGNAFVPNPSMNLTMSLLRDIQFMLRSLRKTGFRDFRTTGLGSASHRLVLWGTQQKLDERRIQRTLEVGSGDVEKLRADYGREAHQNLKNKAVSR